MCGKAEPSAHQFSISPKTGERIQVRNIFSPVIESTTYRHVSKEGKAPKESRNFPAPAHVQTLLELAANPCKSDERGSMKSTVSSQLRYSFLKSITGAFFAALLLADPRDRRNGPTKRPAAANRSRAVLWRSGNLRRADFARRQVHRLHQTVQRHAQRLGQSAPKRL